MLMHKSIRLGACAFAVTLGALVWAWGGEHEVITRAAIRALPEDTARIIGPEREALAAVYCKFPDVNWACYGRWGGGMGDPQAPRFGDTRREWEVSCYCLWDPVLQKGEFYPHAAPYSYECCPRYFARAVDSLRKGKLEDGVRFLGVLLHYAQDTGAFAHLQPIHRNCKVRPLSLITADGYRPKMLGSDGEQASRTLQQRLKELVAFTEKQMAPLLRTAGVDMEQVRQRCSKQTMPPEVVAAVKKVLAERPEEFNRATLACAEACMRLSADVLLTAVTLGQSGEPQPSPAAPRGNLAFNGSFEEDDGDGVPDGWFANWLDPTDRIGRARRYRAGWHWERHVRLGAWSVLLLWAPKKGLEWKQTWPKATRVRPGEKYRLTVWA
ncbi:MAG: hypothetical protein J7M26_02305, partial [Armatimonadetes bacterium]|nr:hypothetical protein [Armatimonadota bacterium]